MVPPPDVPARFGFNVAGIVVTLDASVRSGADYGLRVRRAQHARRGSRSSGTTLTLWGVPADPTHDAERACPGQTAPCQPAARRARAARPARRSSATRRRARARASGCPTTVRMRLVAASGRLQGGDGSSATSARLPVHAGGLGRSAGPDRLRQVPFDPVLNAAAAGVVEGRRAGGLRVRSHAPADRRPGRDRRSRTSGRPS